MATAAADRASLTGQALEVVTAVVRVLRTAAAGTPQAGDGLSLTELRLLKRLGGGVRLASELVGRARCDGADGERCGGGAGAARSGPSTRHRQQQALAALLNQLSPHERRALQAAIPALARALEDQRL